MLLFKVVICVCVCFVEVWDSVFLEKLDRWESDDDPSDERVDDSVVLKFVLVWWVLVDLMRLDEIPGEEETLDTAEEPVRSGVLECVECEKTNTEVAVVDVECDMVDRVLEFPDVVLVMEALVVKSVVR